MFTIKVVFGRVSPNQFPVEFLPNGNRFLRETGESLPKDSGIQRQLETLKILFCMRIRITFFLERFLGETESLYQTGTKTIEPQTSSLSGRLQLVDSTGCVDVIIPDLPSNESLYGIYEVITIVYSAIFVHVNMPCNGLP